MTKRKKVKEPEIGAIAEIPLPHGGKGYARVLKKPLMAFYAIRSEQSLSPDKILNQPIAFKVWVMDSAISSGRWTIVGCSPLEPELEEMPWFFKQDAISKALSLYQGGVERSASKEDCLGLERAAVWSAEHIESRIEDYLDGRPNKWVDALNLKE